MKLNKDIDWESIIRTSIISVGFAIFFLMVGYRRLPMFSSTLAIIVGMWWLARVLAELVEGDPFKSPWDE
jgi:hypothetical protein